MAEEHARRYGIAKSITAAAQAIKRTPRTVRDLRAAGYPGFRPDGTVDLDLLIPEYEKRKDEKFGDATLKSRELAEKVRKLQLANDAKECRLIERAWMAERVHAAAGKIDAFRVKSEAEHPLLFAAAGDDVVKCREVLRKIWDEIAIALNGMKDSFKE